MDFRRSICFILFQFQRLRCDTRHRCYLSYLSRQILVHIHVSYRKIIQTASGHSSTVSGIGTVEFHVTGYDGGNKYRTIRLDNVWYLPTCTRNLVSGSKPTRKGFQMRTNKVGMGICSPKNRLLANARMENGLFRFNKIDPKEDAPKKCSTTKF